MDSETQVHDLWKRKLSPRTIGERVAMEMLETTWTRGEATGDESDRGLYETTLRGTSLRIETPRGWMSMELCDSDATAAWTQIATMIDVAIAATRPPEDATKGGS